MAAKRSSKAASRYLAAALVAGLSTPTAWAEVNLDGSIGPSGLIASVNNEYVIPDTAGRTVGSNLFHSFSFFNVETGHLATFTGPVSPENVLGRVTGGFASSIDGGLRSTIPGANLYLMNPAGIVFGPNAWLDVSGSFHATTADYLRLKDGGRFEATIPANDVLTSAPPEAFGFLGPTTAPIEIEGSDHRVSEGKTLSFIAGDLRIEASGPDESNLAAPGGSTNLVSVAAVGEVVFEAKGVVVDSFPRLGKIETTGDSWGYVWGDGGGTVLIRGGELIVADSSGFSGSVTGPPDESLVDETGTGIDIQVTGKVLVEKGAALTSYVYNGVSHDSGGISIRADEVELNNAQFDSVDFGDTGWYISSPQSG